MLLLLGVVVASLVVLWGPGWWTSEGGGGSRTDAGGTRRPRTDASPPAGVERRALASSPDPTGVVPEDASSQCIWGRGADVLVRVLDGRTGSPVPGAEVLTWRPGLGAWQAPARAELLRQSHQSETLFRRFGETTYTDASGEVLLVEPRVGMGVLGLAPGLRGQVKIARREHRVPVDLYLWPARDLELRVVDATRKPVAGLLLWVALPEDVSVPSGEVEAACFDLSRAARTDREGRAVLKGLEDFARLPGPLPRLQIRAGILGFSKPLADFDPQDPPAAGLRLEIPETGALDVLVRDVDGAPLACLHHITWGGAGLSEDLEDGRYHAQRIGVGEFRFSHVIPKVEFDCWLPHRRIAADAGRILGPSRAGVRASRVVDVHREQAVLALRLRLPDGAPAAFRTFEVFVDGESAEFAWDPLLTDAEGRLRLSVGTPEKGAQVSSLEIRERPGAFQYGPLMHRGSYELALEAGVVEVPEITLGELPVYASGQIRFFSEPLPSHLVLSLVVGAKPDPFSVGSRAHCRVFDDLSFEVRAPAGTGPGDLVLQLPNQEQRRFPVQPGSKNLDLAISRGGRVRVGLILDRWQDSEVLSLALVGAEGKSLAVDLHQTGPQRLGSGGFRHDAVVQGLRKGDYRLVLSCLGQELLAVPDVAILGPGMHEDPRLGLLDLRGRLKTVRLDFGVGGRAPAERALRVSYGPKGSAGHKRAELDPGEALELRLAAPTDLVLRVAGFEEVVLPGLYADTRVDLQPD